MSCFLNNLNKKLKLLFCSLLYLLCFAMFHICFCCSYLTGMEENIPTLLGVLSDVTGSLQEIITHARSVHSKLTEKKLSDKEVADKLLSSIRPIVKNLKEKAPKVVSCLQEICSAIDEALQLDNTDELENGNSQSISNTSIPNGKENGNLLEVTDNTGDNSQVKSKKSKKNKEADISTTDKSDSKESLNNSNKENSPVANKESPANVIVDTVLNAETGLVETKTTIIKSFIKCIDISKLKYPEAPPINIQSSSDSEESQNMPRLRTSNRGNLKVTPDKVTRSTSASDKQKHPSKSSDDTSQKSTGKRTMKPHSRPRLGKKSIKDSVISSPEVSSLSDSDESTLVKKKKKRVRFSDIIEEVITKQPSELVTRSVSVDQEQPNVSKDDEKFTWKCHIPLLRVPCEEMQQFYKTQEERRELRRFISLFVCMPINGVICNIRLCLGPLLITISMLLLRRIFKQYFL